MPKRETRTRWLCTICDRPYVAKKDAADCEERRAAPYRFLVNQVVHLSAPRDEPCMAVIACVADEECDPHEQPKHWSVECLTHQNQGCSERVVHDTQLTPATGTTATCPLCNCTETTTMRKPFWFDTSAVEVVQCDDLAHTKCTSCGVEYFTDVQLAEARNTLAEKRKEVCVEK